MPFLTPASQAHPDRIALEWKGGSLTYGDLARKARELAGRLEAMGVGPGVVVALAGPLDAELLAALHGIWAVGGAVAPMNPRWTPSEEDGALGLLVPAVLVRALEGASGAPDVTRVEPSLEPSEKAVEDQVAARLLTSGTSGKPRVVDLTVANLLASARGAQERLGLGPEDRWLASLSLAHVGGLALVSRAASLGSTLVLSDGFDAEAFLHLAVAGAVTHASLVPTMLHRILDALGEGRAPERLRCLLIGGASTPLDMVERSLAAGLPLALTYGLTEASSQVATAPPSLVREKPGTVGAPLPGTELRLSQEGEILVRGDTVAPGEAGEYGWLRTGDLAREDDDGHLWITGRTTDRIISGGVNVDPGEVASLLRTHPGVEDAVVVGVPDPEWGERVVAMVVPTPEGPPTEADLDRLVRASLAPAKRPRSFHFVEEIPRNPNGKVDREGVRALLR